MSFGTQVVNMEEQADQQKQPSEAKAVKERPVWLTQSTVQGAYSEPDVISNRKFSLQCAVIMLL